VARLTRVTRGHDETFLNDLAEEVRLSLRLLEGGLITRQQHRDALDILNREASETRTAPLSILHILAQIDFSELMNVMTFLSRDSRVPLLPLMRFEPVTSAAALLPVDFAKRRGLLAFDRMADHVMVAILNPYNAAARTAAEAACEHPCLFYLVLAPDYDEAYRRLHGTSHV
jgi:hypothetical protein